MDNKIIIETSEKSVICGRENDTLHHENSIGSTEEANKEENKIPKTSPCPQPQLTTISNAKGNVKKFDKEILIDGSIVRNIINTGTGCLNKKDISVKKIMGTITTGINALASSGITSIGSNLSSSFKLTEKAKNNIINNAIMKRKRKRRPRKSKSMGNTKPYKKSNWKFQAPGGVVKGGEGSGAGGGGNYRSNRSNNARDKFLRSRSIVPYNTNRFLMEEHMAEVPSALLTPSGRTRDSSFSVDSEDYFFSLPEDEEEFLAKEFFNVYEKARRERLESLSKQQLIDEYLQLEERYNACMQVNEQKQQQNMNIDYMNKMKMLEDKIKNLTADNLDLRRKLDYLQNKIPPEDRMCSSSVDSESDSSTSSSSSSSTNNSSNSTCDSEYSRHSPFYNNTSQMEMDNPEDATQVEENYNNDNATDNDNNVEQNESENVNRNIDDENRLTFNGHLNVNERRTDGSLLLSSSLSPSHLSQSELISQLLPTSPKSPAVQGIDNE